MINFHSPGDRILVVDGGKFGERFWKIGKAYGLNPEILKIPYGEAVLPEQIAAAVQKDPGIRSVYVSLCETSTGVVYDIQEIGRRLRGKNVLLVVDAISGLAADRLETDEWGVDLAVSGSQKGLMLPPGLAFLSVNDRAKERMKEARLPRFYFDLALYEKALEAFDTPFTPAISLVVGLEQAIQRIEKVGLEGMLRHSEALAQYTREKVKAMGLELFAKRPSNGVTAFKVPAGVDGGKLLKAIRDEEGITLAGGQGETKGKIIRIAHMGFIQKEDIDCGLQALQKRLHKNVFN